MASKENKTGGWLGSAGNERGEASLLKKKKVRERLPRKTKSRRTKQSLLRPELRGPAITRFPDLLGNCRRCHFFARLAKLSHVRMYFSGLVFVSRDELCVDETGAPLLRHFRKRTRAEQAAGFARSLNSLEILTCGGWWIRAYGEIMENANASPWNIFTASRRRL